MRAEFARPQTARELARNVHAHLSALRVRQAGYDPAAYRELQGANGMAPVTHLHPAQGRYAFLNVLQKMVTDAAKYQPEIRNGRVVVPEHEGKKSFYPLKKAKAVILTQLGLVLVDGHHSTLVALSFGSEHMPIKVVGDLTHLPERELWAELESRGLAYLINLQGKREVPPAEFSKMADDVNRYLASIVSLKLLTANEDPRLEFELGRIKVASPALVKVNSSVPFLEFAMADILYAQGLVPNEKQLAGELLNPRFAGEVRDALLRERASKPDSILAKIDLVEGKVSVEDVVRHIESHARPALTGQEKNLKSVLRQGAAESGDLSYLQWAD